MHNIKLKRSISLVYQNVRGLNTKLNFFNHNLLTLDSDFIAVTESFLTSSVLDSEITSHGWSVLRRDRSTGVGGGVLLAARPGITMTRCCVLETPAGEDMWARFTTNDSIFYVCVVYIHPRASDEIYMRWFQKVESIIDSLKSEVIIVGDLNLNDNRTSNNILSYYCYFLSFCGLIERNEVMNAHGSKLDVVLVSDCISCVDVAEIDGGGLVPCRDAYHPPLNVCFTPTNRMRPLSSEKIDPSNLDTQRDWNFSKGNFEQMHRLISEESWQEVILARDVDTAVECFYNIFYRIFDECVPKKHRPRKACRRYPIWFSAELISDIKCKSDLHRRWKSSQNQVDYVNFSLLRAAIKKRMSLAYDEYIKHIQTKLKHDPRVFWQHINSFKARGGFETRVSYNGKDHVGSDAAHAFSEFFSSVFLPDVPLLDYQSQNNSYQSNPGNSIHIEEIKLTDVETAINKLKPNSAVGPDNIPAYIIKGCKDHLKSPLLHIFNLALSTGNYPQRWKVSRVQPIPKSNGISDIENYWPIAILSTLPKLFESILHRLISFQVQPFLCESQHGFRSNRSVNTNLLTLVDLIWEHLDKGIQVDVLYFDFKKAFECVDNNVLLA